MRREVIVAISNRKLDLAVEAIILWEIRWASRKRILTKNTLFANLEIFKVSIQHTKKLI
jgi:hypothetical protein